MSCWSTRSKRNATARVNIAARDQTSTEDAPPIGLSYSVVDVVLFLTGGDKCSNKFPARASRSDFLEVLWRFLKILTSPRYMDRTHPRASDFDANEATPSSRLDSSPTFTGGRWRTRPLAAPAGADALKGKYALLLASRTAPRGRWRVLHTPFPQHGHKLHRLGGGRTAAARARPQPQYLSAHRSSTTSAPRTRAPESSRSARSSRRRAPTPSPSLADAPRIHRALPLATLHDRSLRSLYLVPAATTGASRHSATMPFEALAAAARVFSSCTLPAFLTSPPRCAACASASTGPCNYAAVGFAPLSPALNATVAGSELEMPHASRARTLFICISAVSAAGVARASVRTWLIDAPADRSSNCDPGRHWNKFLSVSLLAVHGPDFSAVVHPSRRGFIFRVVSPRRTVRLADLVLRGVEEGGTNECRRQASQGIGMA
ncbi:hypothetical protein C8R45DRAFT_1077792 [Mycena sanguinolenta]|nr:hypothetical protein C8R45DRAFT_1077792 [Mycena sanguinolenta]